MGLFTEQSYSLKIREEPPLQTHHKAKAISLKTSVLVSAEKPLEGKPPKHRSKIKVLKTVHLY